MGRWVYSWRVLWQSTNSGATLFTTGKIGCLSQVLSALQKLHFNISSIQTIFYYTFTYFWKYFYAVLYKNVEIKHLTFVQDVFLRHFLYWTFVWIQSTYKWQSLPYFCSDQIFAIVSINSFINLRILRRSRWKIISTDSVGFWKIYQFKNQSIQTLIILYWIRVFDVRWTLATAQR